MKRVSLAMLLAGMLTVFGLPLAQADNEGQQSAAKQAGAKAPYDYPTLARVEYVIGCMNKYGGENYTTMYGCVCAIDKIAQTIPYDNYVATTTLAVMIQTPGERGGVFRDVENGREAIRYFGAFVVGAEHECGFKDQAGH